MKGKIKVRDKGQRRERERLSGRWRGRVRFEWE